MSLVARRPMNGYWNETAQVKTNHVIGSKKMYGQRNEPAEQQRGQKESRDENELVQTCDEKKLFGERHNP